MFKKIINICTLCLALFTLQSAFANDIPAGERAGSVVGIDVENITPDRDNTRLMVQLGIDLSRVNLKGNLEAVFQPMFVNGEDTLRLAPFAVAGRNRWYDDIRNTQPYPIVFRGWGSRRGELEADSPRSGSWNDMAPSEWNLYYQRLGVGQGTWQLELSIPYSQWLEGSTFVIASDYVGCAGCPKKNEPIEYLPVAQTAMETHAAFAPEFIYITPVAEAVKTREIAARAYIDFPVNQIVIYPDYRRNPHELAKIIATIDSIKNDKDITVTSLHISGTASPEGSYQNNVRLAKGRTEALKNYVQKLYKFPAGFITTSYEPVDWDGLRDFLNNGPVGPAYTSIAHVNLAEVLPNRSEIINIVNGGLEPYQKNQSIKNNYSKQYQWLLTNVYPALRHSDYRIQFEIKQYTEVSEILEIMQNSPQKLSLSELFVAANSQPEGSELYNRAFAIAAMMYPEDETANLNAGVNAMKRGAYDVAEKYLAKGGDAPEAIYARAILNYLQGNVDEALEMFDLLATGEGVAAEKARSAAEGIRESLKPDTFTWRLL